MWERRGTDDAVLAAQPVRGIVQWLVERKVIPEDQAVRLKKGEFPQ